MSRRRFNCNKFSIDCADNLNISVIPTLEINQVASFDGGCRILIMEFSVTVFVVPGIRLGGDQLIPTIDYFGQCSPRAFLRSIVTHTSVRWVNVKSSMTGDFFRPCTA